MHPFDGPNGALYDALRADRVLAILRYRQRGDLPAAVDALCAGGVRVLEVTVDTPGCWAAVALATTRPGVFVGAGTVTRVDEVSRLAEVGGRFVVSPGLDENVVRAALEAGLDVFPGVMTGSEVLSALRAGSRYLKLFPAGSLGTRYLGELRGPFRQQLFVPTGGIRIADVADWLRAGAFAVAIGSDLAGQELPRTDADRAALTSRAAEALARARGAVAEMDTHDSGTAEVDPWVAS